jgi:hypothetical protein
MKKEQKIPIYELLIGDIDIDRLTAVSLVDYPAINQDFKFFSDTPTKFEMSKINEEERMIVGPAMIANKEIIRQTTEGELYYVKITEDTIKQLSHKLMREGKMNNITLQHSQDKMIDKIYMVETWMVENEHDKIYTKYGYDNKYVSIGSWCIQYFVENDEIWEKIKNGEIKGYSIEAYLTEQLIHHNIIDPLIQKFMDASKEDKLKIKKIIEKNDF